MAQRLKLEGLMESKAEEDNDNHDAFNNEFGQCIDEEKSNTEIQLTPNTTNKVTKKERETIPGTIALNREGKIGFDDQVIKYLEECSDGSYRCTACGKTSDNDRLNRNRKTNMMKHIETHLEGLSYCCSICQKTFRSKNSLFTHKSVYHK